MRNIRKGQFFKNRFYGFDFNDFNDFMILDKVLFLKDFIYFKIVILRMKFLCLEFRDYIIYFESMYYIVKVFVIFLKKNFKLGKSKFFYLVIKI